MEHINFPHRWTRISEGKETWSAKVEKFRITLEEVTFVEEAVLLGVPAEKGAIDAVVYLDHHRKMSYDVCQLLVVTNLTTGEVSVVDVTYSIDHGFGSYGLVNATSKYNLDALRELAATQAVGDRDVIQPMPPEWVDLEF